MSSNPYNYGYGKYPDKSPKPFSGYACKDITVSGGAVDYSLKDNSTLFNTVTGPIQTWVRNGESDISFKFNSVDNDSIPLLANSDWWVDGFVVTDILVTVSGVSDATMNVYTLGWR